MKQLHFKKLLCLLLVAVLTIFLAACGEMDIPFGSDDTDVNSGISQTDSNESQVSESGESTDPSQSEQDITDPSQSEQNSTEPSQPKQSTPDGDTLINTAEGIWDKIEGCWYSADGRFAYFTYNDGKPAFLSGTWENPIPARRDPADVTSLTVFDGFYTLSLTYPAVSGDAADEQDLRPLLYTMGLDISNAEQGVIRIEAPEDKWRDYTFGGRSYDDAYDAANSVQYATFAEMQEFWTWLTGYWNGDNGKFVCFDQADSSSLLFMQGIWYSGTRGWGEFEKAMSGAMDLPTEFVVYYPPVSNELHGDLPGEYVRISIDWMEVETHNRIYVKIGDNGEWMTYSYAGATEEEARG